MDRFPHVPRTCKEFGLCRHLWLLLEMPGCSGISGLVITKGIVSLWKLISLDAGLQTLCPISQRNPPHPCTQNGDLLIVLGVEYSCMYLCHSKSHGLSALT